MNRLRLLAVSVASALLLLFAAFGIELGCAMYKLDQAYAANVAIQAEFETRIVSTLSVSAKIQADLQEIIDMLESLPKQ